MKRMMGRDHLAQVLLSYGLILVVDEVRQIVFGRDVHSVAAPEWLQGSIQVTDVLAYPVFASPSASCASSWLAPSSTSSSGRASEW